MDIANGHIAILKNYMRIHGIEIYNFGSGKGFTVLEIIRLFEKETGIHIPIKFANRRKGDAPVSFCSPSKALQQLSWRPIYSLEQAMIDIKEII
jgi:UDP-glucose 4-epimerase